MTTPTYSPQFLAYRAAREALTARVREEAARMKAIPGGGTGLFGLTPDHIKATPEWRQAYHAYWQAHRALADLNGRNVKRFKREIAQEQRERRQAALLNR
ncbi:UNVERIFIED_ORG: O-acetyl-ADP-ribose deacetylase (regulator of RNase III) [Sphingomonas sp. R1F5B]